MTVERKQRERRLIYAILGVAAIWLVLTDLAVRIIKDVAQSKETGFLILVDVGCFALSFLILILGRSRLIKLLVRLEPLKNKEFADLCGTWLITITYDQGTGQAPIQRVGTLSIKHTILGLEISGEKLVDGTSKAMVVHEWSSDFVELIAIGERQSLLYAYRIFRDVGDRGVDKIGYVVAHRESPSVAPVFSGEFFDTAADPSSKESLRRGKVVLHKN